MGENPKRPRRPLSSNEKIQRTAAFKRFKEENLENLRPEIEAEAASRDDDDRNEDPEVRALLRAFEKTSEGKEVRRRLINEPMQLRMYQMWFTWEIILRSNTFLKWCKRNKIRPWPIFNLYYCPPRVRISPAMQTFNKYLKSTPGNRSMIRLYEKRGWRVKDLMPQDDYKSHDCPDPSELIPLEKALVAYDMSKKMELILLGGSSQGALVTYGTSKDRNLMEITRRLFPHTEGKHPAYDEEANRCLQQVKRWIAKVEELMRLVDE